MSLCQHPLHKDQPQSHVPMAFTASTTQRSASKSRPHGFYSIHYTKISLKVTSPWLLQHPLHKCSIVKRMPCMSLVLYLDQKGKAGTGLICCRLGLGPNEHKSVPDLQSNDNRESSVSTNCDGFCKLKHFSLVTKTLHFSAWE